MSKQQYIDDLFESMNQLRKLLENQRQESHEEKVATMMQYSALLNLKNKKDTTVGDLAQHLKLSKSSATQLIERLVKAGFVDRVNDQNDRRIVKLLITSSGEEHIGKLKKNFLEKIGKILSRIPEEDLKQLLRIHKELIETLQREQDK